MNTIKTIGIFFSTDDHQQHPAKFRVPRGIPASEILSVLGIFLTAAACFGKPVVDYVNPMIGTAEHGHVYPGATVPFGMVQLSPDTRDNTWDGSSGYHYSDDSILGFSMNHLTGTGCPDLGNILLVPTTGELKLTPGARPGEGYRARFSHDQEMARPGYYEVLLPDYQVKVELTASAHAGFHRYTFPATDAGHIVLDLQHGIGNTVTEAQLTIENNHTASGYRKSDGWGGGKIFYFVMEFSRSFDSAGVAQADKDVTGQQTTGKETKGHFDFKTKAGEQILVRVGLSTVSIEGARNNLHTEIPGWNFDAVAQAAGQQWDKALSVFTVTTPDNNLKQTFYTALYHTMVAPTMLSDVDGQFRGPDGNVHQAKGYDYYTEISIWDIFRAESPLLTLTQPERENDIVETMLAHYKIFGHHTLPVWPEGGMETWCMIGNHAIPIITDAYLKGFRNYNAQEALDDMIASTDQNREQLDAYRDKGFIPTGKDVQSVSKTLEYAYDDACIARMAKALGKDDMADKYARRSQNWTNVFDPSTVFMRGRTADGSWVTPFGKNEQDSITFNEYTEANAWQYNFFVLHDVPGLIARLGGDDKFVARLDEMFDTQETIPNLHMIPDVTGVIGMYSHGNEPDHHVAYLYNYAGQPWKTQARVRAVADMLYTNTPGGICGNDDCGQISAWYVFTALGFYPVDPTSGIYVLGSPLMDKVTLKLDPKSYKGRTFTVVAKNNSAQNPYIQSATLNGRPLTRSWISHDEIVAGGKLVLTMGPNPNKIFGSAVTDRPPGI
ncbi:MAG TPA: GH92 family glycosyl hydrolase [Candidatus Sulfotelmatobacter sp.]|jgi:predicted alpha-1,2-mannosidase|nr:GH92 family glycosyl hydrolase [Candidatus Sulfotelmatobacter sp.]